MHSVSQTTGYVHRNGRVVGPRVQASLEAFIYVRMLMGWVSLCLDQSQSEETCQIS